MENKHIFRFHFCQYTPPINCCTLLCTHNLNNCTFGYFVDSFEKKLNNFLSRTKHIFPAKKRVPSVSVFFMFSCTVKDTLRKRPRSTFSIITDGSQSIYKTASKLYFPRLQHLLKQNK